MHYQEDDFQDYHGESSATSSQNQYTAHRQRGNLNDNNHQSRAKHADEASFTRKSNTDRNQYQQSSQQQQPFFSAQQQPQRSPSKTQLNYQKQDSRTNAPSSHANSPRNSSIIGDRYYPNINSNNISNINYCNMSMQSIESSAIFNAHFGDENQISYSFSAYGFVDLQNLYKDWIIAQFQQLKQARDRFEDSIFIADAHALVNSVKRSPYLSWITDLTWKRCRDLFPRQKFALMHRQNGSSSNTSNSNIGNNGLVFSTAIKLINQQESRRFAYLAVAMNLLRDKPLLLDRIFEGQSLNDVGLYYARLCIDGVWKYIPIDDYFPCSKKSTKLGGTRFDPAFIELQAVAASSLPSNSNSSGPTAAVVNAAPEIWPFLLMKAYAKYLGSYEAMIDGSVEETLRDFTGAAFDHFTTRDKNIISHLIAALDQKYIVLSTVYSELSEKGLLGFGGAEFAAAADLFSVQFEITNILVLFGKTIIEIKDVLGQVVWKGEQDLFAGYAASDLEALQIGKKDNGTFYMSITDFIDSFSDVSICKVSGNGQGFFYSACAVRHAIGGYATRKLRALSSGLCDIELVQKDYRLSRSSASNYLNSTLTVITKSENTDTWEVINSSRSMDYSNTHSSGQILNLRRISSQVVELIEGKDYFVVASLDYDVGSRRIIDSVLACSSGEAVTEWGEFDIKRDGDVLEEYLREKCVIEVEQQKQELFSWISNSYEKKSQHVPKWKQLTADLKMSVYDGQRDLGIGFVACTFENINSYEAVDVEGVDKLVFAEIELPEGLELHRVKKVVKPAAHHTSSIGEDEVLVLEPLASHTFIWKCIPNYCQ